MSVQTAESPSSESLSMLEVDTREKVTLPTEHTDYKGFADVVEYHTHGPAGRVVYTIPVTEFVPGRKQEAPKSTTSYEDYALVLRRVWVHKRPTLSLQRIDLEIQSERLCKAFKDIAINSYDCVDLESVPIKLSTPFRELFFYRNEIQALAENENNDPDLRRDAQVLHNFIQTNGLMSSITYDYDKYVQEGRIPSEILWTIYRPNSIVVVNANGVRECWICRDVSFNVTPTGYNWVMIGLRVGFNGFMLGLDRKFFNFRPLGKRMCDISDLPVVPIEHCDNWPEIKQTLLGRASKLEKILGPRFESFESQVYHGVTWEHDFVYFNSLADSLMVAKQLDERVMVDYKGFSKRGMPPPPGFLEALRNKHKSAKVPARTKPRGMLLPGTLVPPMPPHPVSGPPPIHPRPPGIYQPQVYNVVQPARRSQTRRIHRNNHKYSSESDSSSEWEMADYDNTEFDPDNNADIMEYKTFGSSQDVKEVAETLEDNLEGLATVAEECYNISKECFQLLFPALVPAFGLKTKTWQYVLSDHLEDIKWNTTAFESLQLESGTKDLIQALVKGHKGKASFDDVVPGKGQGLIFLLHGKPGLGKTLTAESVADYLERPLYTIEGGELSTNAADLEIRLNDIFDLTRRWDAVSLLDEADVLLCERKSAEMDRNAVVAVFLRKIEYLQGVLFLTTNRRQDFDDAFKSRIHLTISYPDLSEVAQSNIWKKLIDTNQDVKVDNSWMDEAFVALGKLGLNGRTIRNFLRTAVSFAHARNEPLGIHHILEIIRTELKGEGFNMFSMTPDEHRKMATTQEALNYLQRLVESSQED